MISCQNKTKDVSAGINDINSFKQTQSINTSNKQVRLYLSATKTSTAYSSSFLQGFTDEVTKSVNGSPLKLKSKPQKPRVTWPLPAFPTSSVNTLTLCYLPALPSRLLSDLLNATPRALWNSLYRGALSFLGFRFLYLTYTSSVSVIYSSLDFPGQFPRG